MDDEGRCALPGCDVGIRTAPGRPERRYCTAAHREAARRTRRAATRVHRAAAGDLTGTLPWLCEAAGENQAPAGPVRRPEVRHVVESAEPGAVARAADRRSRRSPRDAGHPHRRRTIPVLGVAGILTGGYAVTARQEPPSTAQVGPDDGSTDAWARRADVALAAVNRQLDTLAQAEQQWTRLPASRTGAVPGPVTALRDRRSVLEQRREALQSQLDAYRALGETTRELADSEQQLRTVEAALADAPATDRRSAEQAAAFAALDEQRDLRIRRCDAQRAAIRSLEEGVSAAARSPFPDDAAATATITGDVLEVVRSGGRGRQRSADPDPSPTEQSRPGPPATPSAATTDDDVLTQLHEQAREVARQARRAEAARTAARRDSAPADPDPARTSVGVVHVSAADHADDDEIEERNARA